ncbi:hypothetical protein K0U00_26655, partial [Paenibacillus sepulcri]|nr:hypothetical protein [Paenibacillus sepulcri]
MKKKEYYRLTVMILVLFSLLVGCGSNSTPLTEATDAQGTNEEAAGAGGEQPAVTFTFFDRNVGDA